MKNYDDNSPSDIESLIVSLLEQGYIKGYIAPDKKLIVLKKQNPFPLPYHVSKRLDKTCFN